MIDAVTYSRFVHNKGLHLVFVEIELRYVFVWCRGRADLGKAGDGKCGMEMYNHNGIATPWLEVGRGSQKLPTDKVHGKLTMETLED